MKRAHVGFVFAALIAFGTGQALAATPEPMGTYDDWSVFKTNGGDGIVCYAVSQPKDAQPTNVKRDPIYFLVSAWPGKSVKGEPSVVPGYPYKSGSTVSVEIGSDKFEFYTENEGSNGGAWMKAPEDERRLLDAMRRGARMVVKGSSTRGTLTTDEYSLKGVSAALDRMGQCQ
ncbi:MAG: hypothetical protein GC199_00610 [Alphaproteobacteria bacterium]|nr:hypothetical protein [Alphaproteobacteria bacterium]